MMRSLYSGVSGLRVHQTRMDVIGNNISNVNTVGFKSSNATFSDILYQTTRSATGPNAEMGSAGQNAMQIGLGANLASITKKVGASGGAQRTDNPFDVMIEGDAFFVVNSGGSNYFTKAGAFDIDAAGTLCTPSGATVMGWQPDKNDPTKCVSDRVSPIRIMSAENMYSEPDATTDINLSGNIDMNDTQLTNGTGRTVNLSFFDKLGNAYTAVMKIMQTEESTNVYSLSISDILGEDGDSIFIKEEVDEEGTVTYTNTSITDFSFGGIDYTAEVDETTGALSLGLDDPLAGTMLTFNGETGRFVSVGEEGDNAPSVPLTLTSDPNPFVSVNVDFSALTMFSQSGTTSITPGRGSLLDGSGAGKKAGSLDGVSIDTKGKVYGKYDNGDSRLLGQLAVTKFANAAGLEAVGNNMFAATQNSGEFDGIGQSVDASGSKLNPGVLEMSNVDLSEQFTDMITTQRGFQANSRIITTSDTLLEELINLKR